MAEVAGRWGRLPSGGGLVLAGGGGLIVVASLSAASEPGTVGTIIASKVGFVVAHSAYPLSWLLVLPGLPGLYVLNEAGWGWRSSGLPSSSPTGSP